MQKRGREWPEKQKKKQKSINKIEQDTRTRKRHPILAHAKPNSSTQKRLTWEADTRFWLSPDQCIAYTFPKCPFSTRRALSPGPRFLRSICAAASWMEQSFLSFCALAISDLRASAFLRATASLSVMSAIAAASWSSPSCHRLSLCFSPTCSLCVSGSGKLPTPSVPSKFPLSLSLRSTQGFAPTLFPRPLLKTTWRCRQHKAAMLAASAAGCLPRSFCRPPPLSLSLGRSPAAHAAPSLSLLSDR